MVTRIKMAWVLSVWSALGLLYAAAGCSGSGGEAHIAWPQGSGYITPAVHRPSDPHKITSETDVTVTGADGRNISIAPGGQGQIPLNGPGAKWVVSCGTGRSITVKDYNGDQCELPHGISVRVDKFGQFVPIAYSPQNP